MRWTGASGTQSGSGRVLSGSIEKAALRSPGPPTEVKIGNLENVASPHASYRSLSGPPGPISPKSLEKVFRGLWPQGSKKSARETPVARRRVRKENDILGSKNALFGVPL